MSLDQNLFTLNIAPNAEDATVVDLTDPIGKVHYRKQRVPGSVYSINVYDPLSESLLATATAPSATSKHKTLQLHNPDSVVELKFSGTLTFKWSFKWEEHEFEWKREECFILRKPDPSVLVAVTKEPAARLKTTSVQLLDYNLNRFDIDDRKGLEIIILTALLTFHDANEAAHTPNPPPENAASSSASGSALTSFLGISNAISSRSRSPSAVRPDPSATPPAIPPRPAPRTGVERIAEMHMVRALQGQGEANEVEVGDEGSIDDFAQYAERLLKDEAMLFITVRSESSAQVQKVLRVVEETKRLRHKSGIAEDEELHQYVSYDVPTSSDASRKGPRRINLNDPEPKGKGRHSVSEPYSPPSNLMIHLSKIDMPELHPKLDGRPHDVHVPPKPAMVSPESRFRGAPEPAKEKGRNKEKEREKERKKTQKEQKRTAGTPPRLDAKQPHAQQPPRPLAGYSVSSDVPYTYRKTSPAPPLAPHPPFGATPGYRPSYAPAPPSLLDWTRR